MLQSYVCIHTFGVPNLEEKKLKKEDTPENNNKKSLAKALLCGVESDGIIYKLFNFIDTNKSGLVRFNSVNKERKVVIGKVVKIELKYFITPRPIIMRGFCSRCLKTGIETPASSKLLRINCCVFEVANKYQMEQLCE